MFTLLVALSVAAEVPGSADSVYVVVRTVPSDVRLGDVVFMEVSVRNGGDQPAQVPTRCNVKTATLRVELFDRVEATRFYFLWDCCPGSADLREEALEPGEVRVLALQMVEVPRLDWTQRRFWDPNKWRPDDYRFDVRCSGLPPSATPYIYIDRRPEKEMEALLKYYDGGFKAPAPPGWDYYRPTLGFFGLLSFPAVCSLPDELAAIEQKLSAGSLRDMVHATRLTAEVYDAKSPEEQRRAADVLFQWLDAQHEIARHWMAMRLVSWSSGNKGLGEYGFEFIDGLIPRLPRKYGGQNWPEQYREQNDSARRAYLDYIHQQQRSPRPTEAEDPQAASETDKQQPPSGQAAPTLTAANARLIGNIRAAGGQVWLPGRGRRLGIAGFGVRLPGKIATAEMVAKLAELGAVEFLSITGPEAADESLDGLAMLPGLRVLALRDTRISDAALRSLRGLQELERVELGHEDNKGTRITGEGLVNLQALPKLRHLYLTMTDVNDAALEHLSSMTNLTGLGLGHTKITSEGLKHIAPLRQLRSLSLYSTQVDDKGLEHLRGLTQLRSLLLMDTKVTDRGLRYVANFKELEYLYLPGNYEVTDEGLEHLQGLTKLRFLSLYSTEISDGGLKYLEGMQKLERLHLDGTNVTAEGIAGLQQALPETEIVGGRLPP